MLVNSEQSPQIAVFRKGTVVAYLFHCLSLLLTLMQKIPTHGISRYVHVFTKKSNQILHLIFCR